MRFKIGIFVLLALGGITLLESRRTTMEVAKPLETALPNIQSVPTPKNIVPKRTSTTSAEPRNAEPLKLSKLEMDSLDKAKSIEEEWERSRNTFLEVDLKLAEEERGRIEQLRSEVRAKEEGLMASETRSKDEEATLRNTLMKNRTTYERDIEALLGSERWNALVGFYRQQWASVGLSGPLK